MYHQTIPAIRPSDHPTIRPSDHPTIRPSIIHPTIRPSIIADYSKSVVLKKKKIKPINRIHSPILFHYNLSIKFIQSFPHVIQLESPPNSTFYRLFKKIDLERAYSLGAIPPLFLGVDPCSYCFHLASAWNLLVKCSSSLHLPCSLGAPPPSISRLQCGALHSFHLFYIN